MPKLTKVKWKNVNLVFLFFKETILPEIEQEGSFVTEKPSTPGRRIPRSHQIVAGWRINLNFLKSKLRP